MCNARGKPDHLARQHLLGGIARIAVLIEPALAISETLFETVAHRHCRHRTPISDAVHEQSRSETAAAPKKPCNHLPPTTYHLLPTTHHLLSPTPASSPANRAASRGGSD